MRIVVDFTAMVGCRPRDVRRLWLAALVAERLGHQVTAARTDVDLSAACEGLPSLLYHRDGDSPDLWLTNCDAARRRRRTMPNCPVAVLSHRELHPRAEMRVVDSVQCYAAVKHTITHPKVLPLVHAVADGVLSVLVEDGLLDAYLDDDTEAIRRRYAAPKRRAAGFLGCQLYGRQAMAKQLPLWCEVAFYRDEKIMSTRDYLRWLSGCCAAIDFPGQHQRTYRFTEAALLGVPVVCVAPEHQPAVPLSEGCALTLRGWDDHSRLWRLMGDLDGVRAAADLAYRRSWSLRAQVRTILERFDGWAAMHAPKEQAAQQKLGEITPPNAELIRLAKQHPAPQEWLEGDEEKLFTKAEHHPLLPTLKAVEGADALKQQLDDVWKGPGLPPSLVEDTGRTGNYAAARMAEQSYGAAPKSPSSKSDCYPVLVVYDRPGWAYHRRAAALEKHAPPGFDVRTATVAEVTRDWTPLTGRRLVFLLDYAHTQLFRQQMEMRAPQALLVTSYNADENRRQDWWSQICGASDWVVCVNRSRFFHRGAQRNCCAISNGIDTEIFRPTVPVEQRPDRALWCGRRVGGHKGWERVLLPLVEELPKHGFQTDFRLVENDGQQLDTGEMVQWYNTGAYILCASDSEGTANPVTEGAACGCVPVSTKVGNIIEWGMSRKNCMLVRADARQFVDGLLYARQNKRRLSAGAVLEMRERWDYRRRAPYYYALFRRLLDAGPRAVKPFCWSDVAPGEV